MFEKRDRGPVCDSLRIDTCLNSTTYNKYYAKKGYLLFSKTYFFKNAIPFDSAYTWEDIDTNYNSIRQAFSDFNNRFCNIKFLRWDLFIESDSEFVDNCHFKIELENYQCVDTIIAFLNEIDSIDHGDLFQIPLEEYTIPQSNQFIIPGTNLQNNLKHDLDPIVPNDFHELGFSWHLYDLKCPLAWEITRGRSKTYGVTNRVHWKDDPVFIMLTENFHSTISNHKELFSDESNYNNRGEWKNFRTIKSGFDAILKTNEMMVDNVNTSKPDCHPLETMSIAIAADDNNPLIGTAPNIMGVLTHYNLAWRIDQYDLDSLKNSIITRPDVFSLSTQALGPAEEDLMRSGVIYVTCIGDNRNRDGTTRNITVTQEMVASGLKYLRMNDNSIEVGAKVGDNLKEYQPQQINPILNGKDYLYPDSSAINESSLDFKAIVIAGLQDNKKINCNSSTKWERARNEYNNSKFSTSLFYNPFTHSRDIYKFPSIAQASTTAERIRLKAQAHVDVVAPAISILSANESIEEDDYDHDLGGVSLSAPMVGGIIGLMVSVNRHLGVNLNVDNSALGKKGFNWFHLSNNGQEVQRRAYNIVTFTADKIIDADSKEGWFHRNWYWESPESIYRWSGTFEYHSELANDDHRFDEYQFDYVEQANDNLKRWWAQRMGFGRVNAYRCVAHAIANKGDYRYTSSNSLNFDPIGNGNESPEGSKLLHLGSKIHLGRDGVPLNRKPDGSDDDELNVLEWGGTSIPGDVHSYNNQGVTLLDDQYNQIELVVPQNSILAIDGLLIGKQIVNGHPHSISSTGNGKILLTSYMRDVALKGIIKTSDLVLQDATLEFNYDTQPTDTCEIYGKVELKGNSSINLYDNGVPLIVQPGGEIFLNGDNDLIIENGNQITMMPGSYISTTSNVTMKKKVIIRSGGLLVIGDGTHPAKVNIDCEVEVEDGGELLFEENSLVTLKKFTIINGGTFTVSKKCTLRLIDEESICNGNFIINGALSNRVLITSISENQKEDMCNQEVQNLTKIICSGYNSFDIFSFLPNPKLTTLKLNHVDFNSVSIKARNFILPPIMYCNFSTNTKQLLSVKPNFKLPNSFLEMNNNQFYPAAVLILNCTFTDNFENTMMSWLTFDDQENANSDNKFHLNGITVSGFLGVSIDNSSLFQFDKTKPQNDPQYPNYDNLEIPDNHHFVGLNTGIYTTNCARVEIKNCNFLKCRAGNNDYSSSVWLCLNTSHRVNTPNALNLSKRWRTSDNFFNQSNKAANLFNISSGQDFTSNEISDFYNGFFIQEGIALFRDEVLPPYPIPWSMVLNGMNVLEIPDRTYPNINDYAIDLLKKANPFTSSALNKFSRDERADFFLSHKGANLLIDHGYNYLSNFTNKHIYYKKTNQNDPPKSLDLSYNNWRPGTLRLENVTNSNSNDPINSTRDMQTNCYFRAIPISGIENQYFDPCNYFSRNTGQWAFLNSSDTVLDNEFYSYLNDFCNGILSCDCYRQRLFDLMQLAVLGDSVNEKLQMVIDCISDKSSDPVYSYLNCNSTNLLLLLGEACERTGLIDDAVNTYLDIVTNSDNPSDTMLARWRLMNLEAIQSDSTYGFVYDSLMAEYYLRVDRDITSTEHGSVTPPPPPAIMQNNDESQQEPEPIGQDTTNTINSDEKKNKASSGLNPNFNQNTNETDEIATLEQNSPNPFTNETVIVFHLNREADVRLGIHNALGHTIKEVVNQRLRKGKYVYTFQNENNASGVYLYLLTTDGKQIVKKMQLVK